MAGPVTIRPCTSDDFDAIHAVVNAAATAYEGVIPTDRYHVPYMPADELRDEIAAEVRFWGWFDSGDGGELLGVMGIQDVDDVTLIRHAYVAPAHQGRGIGGGLLEHLMGLPQLATPSHDHGSPRRPLLVGTWADAVWAVRFYERNGFRLVTPAEKDRLLRRYWRIPERQVETSVVLRYVGRVLPFGDVTP
jgi:GNAT superfamily N-acetyltransferase